MAYQIAADLNDNENHNILNAIAKELNKVENPSENIARARDNLTKVLKGQLKDDAYFRFFTTNNQTDPAIMLHLKQTVDVKNSIVHGGCLSANAILNAYTADDNFLRNNIGKILFSFLSSHLFKIGLLRGLIGPNLTLLLLWVQFTKLIPARLWKS